MSRLLRSAIGGTPVTTRHDDALSTGSSAALEQVGDSPAWVMDDKIYGTARSHYELWTDSLISRARVPPIVFIGVSVVTVYLVGLIIASSVGFLAVYVRTLAVYLGLMGIAWVFGWLRWGSSRVHAMFVELRPIFPVEDSEYLRVVAPWFKKLSDNRKHAQVVLGLFVAVIPIVGLSFYAPGLLHELHWYSLRPVTFPNAWYTPADRIAKVAIILWFGACCAAALGTAGRLLVVNIGLLWSLRTLPVVEFSHIVRSRLRRVTNFYVGVSFEWTAAIGLFVALFWRHYDIPAVCSMALLGVLGILTFLVPQLAFRRVIIASHETICDRALHTYLHSIGIGLHERETRGTRLAAKGESLSLAEVVDATVKPATWVYDSEDLLLLLFAQLVAVTGVLIQLIR